MRNVFLSDARNSPYIQQAQGFALKQGDKEIKIKDLSEDLEVNMQTDLTSISQSYSEKFKADTKYSHRFRLPPDYKYYPLLVYVKPENNKTLTALLNITFEEGSPGEYKLRFSPMSEDKHALSPPFRKVDNFTYIAWDLPSRPVFFNLTVMATGPFPHHEVSDNESRGVQVNYTVAIYSTRCMFWGVEEGKWLEEGCKVRNCLEIVLKLSLLLSLSQRTACRLLPVFPDAPWGRVDLFLVPQSLRFHSDRSGSSSPKVSHEWLDTF